ncbi:TIGR00300 family protein [Iamia sp. SCSIO 61187]|uniref:ornithine cyclodeaminase n=1 Tax=Iamia sp. SCSIO 61187 TaxID=2722752 RepID=UPI001C638101|nr:TIGR00300 family protein [Iamia sp. SCSIO 61187]
MTATETFALEGHIVDSLILPKVLDLVLESGSDYRLLDVAIGRTPTDPSRAVIEVTAPDDQVLATLAEQLQVQGANPLDSGQAETEPAPADGVAPVDFTATTNLVTEVRIDGRWITADRAEMDCTLVVRDDRVVTTPLHRLRRGDAVVVGSSGVRVVAPDRGRGRDGFEFMDSDISTEKPKATQLRALADRLRQARADGVEVLAVCGPVVIHTGGGPAVARLVQGGWIQRLFAGNGFATHDIESAVMGTSLGINVASGAGTEGGHSNHLRVINEVRRHGSIAAAVEAGYVPAGVMHACVTHDIPFVLGGSVRDDGPLPDTMTDVVEVADRMRDEVAGVGVALMLASTLHAIATGNVLPASVATYCIDINPSVVTKLSDRGSHQAHGIVTDVGPFLGQLADELGA